MGAVCFNSTLLKRCLTILACISLSISIAKAQKIAEGQTYPTKMIQVIVPFPPGGMDISLRFMQPFVEKELGQKLIIENRSGANGYLGSEHVARSAPDGYTLLYNSSSSLLMLPLTSSVRLDAERDFAPISNLVLVPEVLVVRSSLPVNSLAEYIEFLKKNPGKISYASPGTGSVPHVLGETFARNIGVPMIHVAYRGNQALLQALFGGEADSAFVPVGIAKGGILSGNVKVLAIDKGEVSPDLPKVPDLTKVLPGFETIEAFAGFWAPANTPKAIVEKLNRAINKAVEGPDVRSKLEDGGGIVSVGSPEAFAATVASNIAIAKKQVEAMKAAGIKFE